MTGTSLFSEAPSFLVVAPGSLLMLPIVKRCPSAQWNFKQCFPADANAAVEQFMRQQPDQVGDAPLEEKA